MEKAPPFEPEQRESGKLMLPKEFFDKIDGLNTQEAKLDQTLLFMQKVLQTGEAHQIRDFWEAKKLCLTYFYGQLNPMARVSLWARYSELCGEAHRLKEIFEEQSSFISEQIEKAIEAFEEELVLREASKGCDTNAWMSKATSRHAERYAVLQHDLEYLNTFATKITSLRKELMKAEVKYKRKQRLLDRLRHLGDLVFPKRKEFIQEESVLFVDDVNDFVQARGIGNLRTYELLEVREEIKFLQRMAKELTLSTEAFTKTRFQLSECWENIRLVLKERKRAFIEHKEASHRHRDEIVSEVDEILKSLEQKTILPAEARKRAHHITSTMRTVSLAHQDIALLRERIAELEQVIDQTTSHETKSGISHDRHKIQLKEFLERVLALKAEAVPLSEREDSLRTILHDMDESVLTREERLTIDRELTAIRRGIEKEHEHIVQSLCLKSEEEINTELACLERLLSEMRRILETWKRFRAASGSDFAQAIEFTDFIEEEKIRIEFIGGLLTQLTKG